MLKVEGQFWLGIACLNDNKYYIQNGLLEAMTEKCMKKLFCDVVMCESDDESNCQLFRIDNSLRSVDNYWPYNCIWCKYFAGHFYFRKFANLILLYVPHLWVKCSYVSYIF